MPDTPQTEPTAATQPQSDPSTLKLEGETIPEEFRGKTLADVLKSQQEAKAALSREQAAAAQWRAFGEEQARIAAGATARPKEPDTPPYNPVDDLGEANAKAVNHIVQQNLQEALQKTLLPVMTGVAAIQKEMVRSVRPDFDKVEARAKQYFDSMPLEARFNPQYGWDFAYRMASAEAMGSTPMIPKDQPPQPGPSTGSGGAPTTPKYDELQQKWMGMMGMSPEQFEKYSQPQDPVGDKLRKEGKLK